MGGKKDPLDRFSGMQSVVFKWGNFIVRVIERITLLNFAIIVDRGEMLLLEISTVVQESGKEINPKSV